MRVEGAGSAGGEQNSRERRDVQCHRDFPLSIALTWFCPRLKLPPCRSQNKVLLQDGSTARGSFWKRCLPKASRSRPSSRGLHARRAFRGAGLARVFRQSLSRARCGVVLHDAVGVDPVLAVVLQHLEEFPARHERDLVPKMMDRTGQRDRAAIADTCRSEGDSRRPRVRSWSPRGQAQVVEKIQSFIDNINAGTLSVVGSVALIFVAIRLLMTIEQTFNDIWGVQKGRSIWRKIVYYWTTITLGPLLLLVRDLHDGQALSF